jgi:hypothetical protein
MGDRTPDEMVFTTLSKEGMPLIRYRTRDITTLDHGACDCGRTLARMSKARRRAPTTCSSSGCVNVFPSQIEAVLLNIRRNLPVLHDLRRPGRRAGHYGDRGESCAKVSSWTRSAATRR